MYHLVTHPDPAYTHQHRKLRLLTLERLYFEIEVLRLRTERLKLYNDTLTARLKKADEDICRGIWTVGRVIESARNEEILDNIEQVLIDAWVAKHIDPAFSFVAAISKE